jgi:catechol 2,3-dioxygenase-like lactoylglutathione lyase family enzyme
MRVIEPVIPESIQPAACAPRFHHIAIQTGDLDNCVAWYQDFFGGRVSWSLSTFSETTRSRLPGIRRLIEIFVGSVRLHLFERPVNRAAQPMASVAQFQHVCVSVISHAELMTWRDRWLALYASGSYEFAVSGRPTEIAVAANGDESFYAFDVNGLEFEFTYEPGGVQ